jgi:alkanesulfonate monooxygenase SsuD/methylene tetrahydromethanopterin reductase-like flavin-dependent oxidoreductase (luciferase family)
MTGEPRCAVGVPNVGPFGDPRLLVELAVAAEEHGWDGFFVWDHLLYHDQRWDVAILWRWSPRSRRARSGSGSGSW